MTLVSVLGRAVAVAAVVAGIVLFTLSVQGMTRVDTRLELAAAEQVAPKYADCPFRDHGDEREDV
jgi:hypothetical protein